MSQNVLFNDGTRAFLATVSVSRIYDTTTAESMINQASANPPRLKAGELYGLCTVTVKVLETSDGGPVSLSANDFSFYNSAGKKYRFSSIKAPSMAGVSAFRGTVNVGGSLTGNLGYIYNSNDHSPRLAFGADENGNGGAWMRLNDVY